MKEQQRSPGKILIIDDQPFMVKLIQHNLQKLGYETVVETDALKALENIELIMPDLVILDIRMPGMSGTELCREFRKKEKVGDIPIIILTGLLDSRSEAESIDSGATDFMTKPFSPVELGLKVSRYIG